MPQLKNVSRMKDRQEHLRSEEDELGDVPPEIFRKQIHELADWIADYRENIEKLRVAPNGNRVQFASRFQRTRPSKVRRLRKSWTISID